MEIGKGYTPDKRGVYPFFEKNVGSIPKFV